MAEMIGINKKPSIMVNPVIGKMQKHFVQAEPGEKTATYGGVALKTAYMLLLTVAGVVLYFLLHSVLVTGAHAFQEGTIHLHEEFFDVTTNMAEATVLIFAGFLVLIMPMFAWGIRSLIPVVGTLYGLAQGVLIGFMTNCLGVDYKWIALLAMVLTLALVSVMLFLYAKRIVRVNKKFKAVITILFFTAAFGGVITFVLGLIPGLSSIMDGLQVIMQEPAIGLISGVLFIIIGALFLLADFDSIEHCVENRMAKKYEWMAAWGLAYTVIYLYLKIFNLIIRLTGKKESE